VYHSPATLDEAVEALWQSGGEVLAGGTDFYPALGERIPARPIVDITGVTELRGITIDSQSFRIGGCTTWTDVISSALPPCFDGLKAAAQEIGSVQIQTRGTVAGNLCNASPAADSVPPLLTLDAEVELRSRVGTRRVRLAEFIVGNRRTLRRPDEILSAVIVPRAFENCSSAFLKLGARRYLVISIAMVGVLLDVTRSQVRNARVAVGSCSVRAQRLTELENDLAGAPLRRIPELVSLKHVHGLAPIDDVRATGLYRRDAVITLVKRALKLCAEKS